MSGDAERIIRDLAQGDFRLTNHAKKRMAERRVRFEDIRSCAETVKSWKHQDNGKYLIAGLDLDGETVVITLVGD